MYEKHSSNHNMPSKVCISNTKFHRTVKKRTSSSRSLSGKTNSHQDIILYALFIRMASNIVSHWLSQSCRSLLIISLSLIDNHSQQAIKYKLNECIVLQFCLQISMFTCRLENYFHQMYVLN